MTASLLWAALVCVAADGAATPVGFEYHDLAEHAGRSLMHYRAIEFFAQPVQPLSGEFAPTPGAKYGQVPVGPVPETALGVVWIPEAAEGPTLWFDANGDGRLTASDERHVMTTKDLEIQATITVDREPAAKQVLRTLLFRRTMLGSGLRYAVRGYAAGSLDLSGVAHAALLVDGNANGCLDSVGQDRVWIDLNQDGQFDGLLEQFPLGKPVHYEGQVYVVRSDALATAVAANVRRPGEGQLRLTVAESLLGKDKRVTKFSAQLVSDLGEFVVVDKLDEPIPVSHGSYRLSALQLQMVAADSEPWDYAFAYRTEKNFAVPPGQETVVPVLSRLVMEVTFNVADNRVRPAETVIVRPQVNADDTLYLSSCTVGEGDRARSSESTAEILLLSPTGQTVSRGLSGFS